jgi:hypothetical protein
VLLPVRLAPHVLIKKLEDPPNPEPPSLCRSLEPTGTRCPPEESPPSAYCANCLAVVRHGTIGAGPASNQWPDAGTIWEIYAHNDQESNSWAA